MHLEIFRAACRTLLYACASDFDEGTACRREQQQAACQTNTPYYASLFGTAGELQECGVGKMPDLDLE